MRWRIGWVAVLLALLVASGGAVAAGEWQQPVIELKRVEKPPVIDGDLSDAVWAATPAVGFRQFPKGTPSQQATTARIATDGTWLFVAFDAKDRTPQSEPKDGPLFRPDSLLANDRVEVLIDPGSDGQTYFQFVVDRFGRQWDGRASRTINSPLADVADARAFAGHWRSAGKRQVGGWAVEIALPLCYFEDVQWKKDAWRVNLLRHETNPVEVSAWSLPGDKLREAARFGQLAGLPAETAPQPFLPVLAGVHAGAMSMMTRQWVYPVQVTFRNDSAKVGGKVNVLVDDAAPGGGRRQVKATVEVPVKVAEFAWSQEMVSERELLPDPIVTVSLEDKLGRWQQTLANLEGGAESTAFDVFLDHNYYTTETQAVVYCQVARPERELSGAIIGASILDYDGKPVGKPQTDRYHPGENSLALPLATLPPGTYSVEVGVRGPAGNVLERKTLTLRRLPPLAKGNEVKVDHYNRCVLVNGKPFFPYGVCRLSGDLETIKNLGFNTVWRWGGHFASAQNPDISPQQAAREEFMLREAERLGLMVVERLMLTRWWSQWKHNENMATTVAEWTKKDVPEVIEVIQSHPGLLGYMGFDEPGEMGIYPGPRLYSEICADTMQAFHQNDPYHPAFHNYGTNAPTEAKWKFGQDLYQIYHGSVRGRALAEIDARNNQIAAQDHKPLWVMLWQGGGVAGQWSPTIERARVYTALIHGATGIYFWTWPAIHVDTHRVMAEMAKEIEALSPALLRRRPKQEVVYQGIEPPHAAVDASLAVMPDGTPVLLMVNQETYAVELTCTLPWLPKTGGVQGFFDGKKATVRNGTFSMNLEGMGTRVLRITGHPLTDLKPVYAIRLSEKHPPEARAPQPTDLLDDAAFDDPATWGIPETVKGQVKFDSANPHAGKAALRITKLSLDEPWFTFGSRPIRLLANRRYTYSGWLRSELKQVPDPLPRKWAAAWVFMRIREGDYASLPTRNLPTWGCSATQPDWRRVVRNFVTGDQDLVVGIDIRAGTFVGDVWFDDFRLTDLGPIGQAAGPGVNIAPNSSFEYTSQLRGWPDFWQPSQYGDFLPREQFNPEEMRLIGTPKSPWGQDTENPYHGKYCLRMEASARLTQTPYWGVSLRVEAGKPYVFSLYLRANRDGQPVQVRVTGIGEKRFELTQMWQRYVLTGTYQPDPKIGRAGYTQIHIEFPSHSGGAIVWLDALQLEEGTEPTEYKPDAHQPKSP